MRARTHSSEGVAAEGELYNQSPIHPQLIVNSSVMLIQPSFA